MSKKRLCVVSAVCVYSDSIIVLLFSMTTGAPLTPEVVTEAVKDMEWGDLCWCLRAPNSKCDEIRTQYPPRDHRRVLVGWWFSTDPAPSWRRLIQRLDARKDTETADKIRCNAEPVEGMLSTYMSMCM